MKRIPLSLNDDEVKMLSQVLEGRASLSVLARNPRFIRLTATINRARKRAEVPGLVVREVEEDGEHD